MAMCSDPLLTPLLYLLGEIKNWLEAVEFLKGRSFTETAKTSFSNSLLFLFLQEERIDVLIALYLLNYLVSVSSIAKAQSIGDRVIQHFASTIRRLVDKRLQMQKQKNPPFLEKKERYM